MYLLNTDSAIITVAEILTESLVILLTGIIAGQVHVGAVLQTGTSVAELIRTEILGLTIVRQVHIITLMEQRDSVREAIEEHIGGDSNSDNLKAVVNITAAFS